MDDNPPQNPQEKRSQAPDGTWQSPVSNGTGKSWLKVFAFLEVGIFEIFFVGVVLILLFGTLNYFNILSLSALYPQLGFLPQNQVSPTISPFNQLSCPSLKEFCQKGEGVIKDGKYIGFGGKLASGSAIFAAFDGALSSTTNTFQKEENGQTVEKRFVTAYLDNSELGLRGIYYFRGSIPKSGKVAKGEQIGISNGKVITIYDNKSLIFSLIAGYPKTNNPIILNKENFSL